MRTRIGACRRHLDRDINLAVRISNDTSLGSSDAISVTGVKTVREREQNARKDVRDE